jgi:hypothetical protein
MTRARILIAAGALVALAGCGESGRQPAAEPANEPANEPADGWTEPAAYSYTVDSRCGERLVIGRIRMWVAGGEVTRVQGLDEGGRNAVQAPVTSFPTLGDLMEEYRTATRTGADKAIVEFDAADGHPARIDIDQEKNAVDDEACYSIVEFSTS